MRKADTKRHTNTWTSLGDEQFWNNRILIGQIIPELLLSQNDVWWKPTTGDFEEMAMEIQRVRRNDPRTYVWKRLWYSPICG